MERRSRMTKNASVKATVRRAYAGIARETIAQRGKPQSSCCACGPEAKPGLPEGADMGLSCGDPVGFSEIMPGDVVLDLGSGGGKDVFLAAQRTGLKGQAIGVDMTDDMLRLARRNARRFAQSAGLRNIEFRKGEIENLPCDAASVDVVISNCVINLSPDKPRVFSEAFRVLKPGGRMIVSDIVLLRPLPKAIRESEACYVACLSGAIRKTDYLAAMRQAGFSRLKVLASRPYRLDECGGNPLKVRRTDFDVGKAAQSITVCAVKPQARTACKPGRRSPARRATSSARG